MCKFKPFNKHVLVKKFSEAKIPDLSPVLIPEDAQVGEQQRYGTVEFICAATDCEQFLKDLNPGVPSWATQRGTHDDVFTTSAKNNGHASLVVDKSMIEEIKIEETVYYLMLENHAYGLFNEG